MITNPDTRSSRLERLAKLARVALVEALNRMAAHQVREAARLPAAMCNCYGCFILRKSVI